METMAKGSNVIRFLPRAACRNRTDDLRITRFDVGLHRGVWACADVLEPSGGVHRRAGSCMWVAASVAANWHSMGALRTGQQSVGPRLVGGGTSVSRKARSGYADTGAGVSGDLVLGPLNPATIAASPTLGA